MNFPSCPALVVTGVTEVYDRSREKKSAFIFYFFLTAKFLSEFVYSKYSLSHMSLCSVHSTTGLCLYLKVEMDICNLVTQPFNTKKIHIEKMKFACCTWQSG